ncbi:MAG: MFS transporter, partial [Chloroflexota bacterium]
LGTVVALQTLPVLCMSLFAGVIIDRVPKHRLLLGTQTTALIQSAILAALTLSGHIQLWQIYILATMLDCVNAFDNPTRQSFVMELVGRENLVNAVGLNSAQFNSARLIGPSLGGLVIAQAGVGMCFLVNSVSFFASLAALLMLRTAELHVVSDRRVGQRVVQEFSEGIRYLRRMPQLLTVIIVLAGIGCFGYNWNTVTPLVATDLLHVGAEGFGLLVSGLGLGSLGGAVVVAVRGRASMRVLLGAAGVFSLAYLALALTHWYGLSFALFAVLGFVGLTFSTAANTMLQLGTPDRLRGRVMAVYTLLMLGSTPIGSLFTGFLTGAAGIQWTIATEGSICVVAVSLAIAYQLRHRSLSRGSPDAAARLAVT